MANRTRVRGLVAADTSAESRFGARVKVMPNGCWAFNGNLDVYGQFRPYKGSSENVRAHRYAYELLVGDIPDDCHLHHECQHPGCVNPDHLIPLYAGQHHAEHALIRMDEPKTTDEMFHHVRMLNRRAGLRPPDRPSPIW